MIIVQLKGGLGNQLFQYAAGLALATHHGVAVKVDITELKQPDEAIGTFRNYELQYINHPPVIATKEEIDAIVKQPFLKKYSQKLLPAYKRKIYKEAAFTFDTHFFHASGHLYLKGYRQSEKYFKNLEPKIREELFLTPSVYENVKPLGETIQKEEAVSIHIRRGDYTNPVVQQFHGILSQQYYQQAIHYIQQQIANPRFYIFSDNIEWVQQSLQLPGNAVIVSGQHSSTHYEDFYLMTCCSHHIIANSSFSWWCAWFNSKPNKKVVAPAKWFHSTRFDTSDVIPPNWIKINA